MAKSNGFLGKSCAGFAGGESAHGARANVYGQRCASQRAWATVHGQRCSHVGIGAPGIDCAVERHL